MNLSNLKIAIVCDWLTLAGGAEKVIYGIHQLFPNAPIFTPVYNEKNLPEFKKADIRTSWLQNFSLARKKHQYFLPFYPAIFENFNLDDFDLIISSSHSCSKGIITGPNTLHISYCHSPMRYAWDNNHSYIKNYNTSSLIKKVAPFLIHKLRLWDRQTADRVDLFISNSDYVKQRIKKFYRRDSETIFPFINIEDFKLSPKKDFYLAVGRLTAYKRFDLLIDTFNQLGLHLKIVGSYNSTNKLKLRAKSNIEFLGFVNQDKLKELYSEAKALVFPQIEDFGIVPLEAMASGTPVIAFQKGGAVETVVDQKTGIFFNEQSVTSLAEAISKFETIKFDPEKIRAHAAQFDQKVFNQKLLDCITKKLIQHRHDTARIL